MAAKASDHRNHNYGVHQARSVTLSRDVNPSEQKLIYIDVDSIAIEFFMIAL
jgi:hypothetical protein